LLIFSLLLSGVSVSSVKALGERLQTDEVGFALNYEKLQNTLASMIDSSLLRLDSLGQKIVNNQYLDEEDKQSVLSSLDEIKTALSSYKARVLTASSLAELQVINQEILTYLKDNKDVFKENIIATIIAIGDKVVEQAEELKKIIKSTLSVLKVACHDEAENINQLEGLLVKLENQIAELQIAIDNKDAAGVKQSVKNLEGTTQEVLIIVNQLYESCDIPLG